MVERLCAPEKIYAGATSRPLNKRFETVERLPCAVIRSGCGRSIPCKRHAGKEHLPPQNAPDRLKWIDDHGVGRIKKFYYYTTLGEKRKAAFCRATSSTECGFIGRSIETWRLAAACPGCGIDGPSGPRRGCTPKDHTHRKIAGSGSGAAPPTQFCLRE